MDGPPLLQVQDLTVRYRKRSGWLHAAQGVSLAISEGMTVALVGESGSGKSTVARAIAGLVSISGGSIRYRGTPRPKFRRRPRPPWLEVQMVFQDPSGSLDPRMRVGKALEEVLAVHHLPSHGTRAERVLELLESVGLDAEVAAQHPRRLSGGQRQRIALARTLSVEPGLLLLDEPVSALDVSIRAQILQLLRRVQLDLGLAYLFITHDLATVPQIADRVLVMYRGRIVEEATVDDLFIQPRHPYTQLLLESVPSLDGPQSLHGRTVFEGPLETSKGCAFAPRCPYATEECFAVRPSLEDTYGHRVACHNWRQLRRPAVSQQP
jgi:oligopeptide/dipeptide ABC transporter ATP-binding protein